MAVYPGAIPSFTTITSAMFPQAADNNVPNAELVAFCTALGINPQVIVDTTAPGSAPASVAAYLSMVANIMKTLYSASAWTRAGIPAKTAFFGNCLGQTVPASGGGTMMPVVNGTGMKTLASSFTPAAGITTYPGKFSLQSFWVQTLTAQPADGALTLSMAGGTSIVIPKSAPASLYRYGGSYGSIPNPLPVNYFFEISITNASASPSAQIGAWAIAFQQAG